MAVEGEMPARFAARERRDDVRHRLLWSDHAIGDVTLVQQLADMCRRLARVTRRIRTSTANELPQEVNQDIAVGFYPLQQF